MSASNYGLHNITKSAKTSNFSFGDAYDEPSMREVCTACIGDSIFLVVLVSVLRNAMTSAC